MRASIAKDKKPAVSKWLVRDEDRMSDDDEDPFLGTLSQCCNQSEFALCAAAMQATEHTGESHKRGKVNIKY